MSKREVVVCDGCGREISEGYRWKLGRSDELYSSEDFCSRGCVLRKLSEPLSARQVQEMMGADAPHRNFSSETLGEGASPEPGFPSHVLVPFGSFAWAMNRVQQGASVRHKGTGPHMIPVSRENIAGYDYMPWPAWTEWLAAEWEEV